MVSAPPEANRIMNSLPDNFLTTTKVEPVGRWFLSYWTRLQSHRTFSITGNESESESENEASETEDEFEDDLEYLRSLDPKETKDQDHYRVLGISKLRIDATDEQIKKAYRFKVLRHHPDKRRALGEEIREGDDYFTCITKASEILSVPAKRRGFDSVDPLFDDDVPELKKSSNQDFFDVFRPYFELNERWSVKKPIPKLGSIDDDRDKVDKFYKFWYNFDSWREYSYLDEEDKEKGSDREERRWIEKNNKVQRAEKKKEEMKRIRKLVDNAYNSDPRIKKFTDADKQEKLDRKKAKQDAIKARKDEEERIRREAEEKERAEKEAKAAEDKAKAETAKKEKEVHKKAVKKERKALRNACKENNYYAGESDDQVQFMSDMDRLCEIMSLVELEALNKDLAEHTSDREAGRTIFVDAVETLNQRLDKEKMDMMTGGGAGGKAADASKGVAGAPEWSSDELGLLIKAVNLFPAGTSQRWEVVSSFILQHTKTPEIKRSAKETLCKAKELQQGDFHLSSLKDEANKKAYENLENSKKREVKVESAASERMETAAEAQGLNVTPWGADEQKLLEQALKTYPSSLGAERWEKISQAVPNRSKKDCMKRYKELAEIIRAKKAAQAAAQKK